MPVVNFHHTAGGIYLSPSFPPFLTMYNLKGTDSTTPALARRHMWKVGNKGEPPSPSSSQNLPTCMIQAAMPEHSAYSCQLFLNLQKLWIFKQ